jgi:hypothetical protein
MRGRTLLLFGSIAVAATALLAFTAGSSAASLVQHYHFAFTCTSGTDPDQCIGPNGPTEISTPCDLPGTTVDSQFGNVQIFADGTRKIEWSETYVFTSALTGKSIESRSEYQLTNDASLTVFTLKGLEQQLKLPNGRMLVRDAGPVTFSFDPVTGGVTYKGPHPLIASGGDLFCAVVVPALS